MRAYCTFSVYLSKTIKITETLAHIHKTHMRQCNLIFFLFFLSDLKCIQNRQTSHLRSTSLGNIRRTEQIIFNITQNAHILIVTNDHYDLIQSNRCWLVPFWEIPDPVPAFVSPSAAVLCGGSCGKCLPHI